MFTLKPRLKIVDTIKGTNYMKNIILILFALFLSNSLLAQSKIALVIGNSNYQQVSLKNPVNDAQDLSSTLRSLGFEVIQKTNLNHRSMEIAITEFKSKIRNGDVALFYFSGHGSQVDGINYLIPSNEIINNEIDIKYKSINAGYVLDNMEQAGAGINIIILDACRNNPFSGHRSSSRGFAFMNAPTGSIIAYSTAPGSVALDGNGRNSPFTGNLIEKMREPGLKIEEIFKEVRKDVAYETNRRQIPWESSSLMGDFYFTKSSSPRITSTIENTYKPTTKLNTTPHENYNGNSGTFTDTRDGQIYKWVRIGNQIWMAENLKYSTSGSKCYKQVSGNCEIYGRLYSWERALSSCPKGWHLPDDNEWDILRIQLGGKHKAGNKLKSKDGWKNSKYKASNFSGFNAKPAGVFDSFYFAKILKVSYFWSKTKGYYKSNPVPDRPHSFELAYNSSGLYRTSTYVAMDYISVRCIKN